jgi:hypothetical protein
MRRVAAHSPRKCLSVLSWHRSHFSSEWSSVLVLLESALLRLTGMHEVHAMASTPLPASDHGAAHVYGVVASPIHHATSSQQSIGGDNWKGYSKAFVAALWQPSLPSFERLKSETMLLVANTSTSVRQAAARTSIEDRCVYAAESTKATSVIQVGLYIPTMER